MTELDDVLAPWAGEVHFYVVDDASKDETRAVLDGLVTTLRSQLHVETNATNMGHGPTALRAYELALETDPDYVLQVDGDGQFDSAQCWDLMAALADGDVSVGVRTSRTDPWFRKLLSAGLRVYLRLFFGVSRRDPNCPFRLYSAPVLRKLLTEMPPGAAIPTIYLTVLESRRGMKVAETNVRHRVRRGNSAQGTTWGRKARSILIPKRLVKFAWSAVLESLRFRARLRSG